jgi:hypothetical protein
LTSFIASRQSGHSEIGASDDMPCKVGRVAASATQEMSLRVWIDGRDARERHGLFRCGTRKRPGSGAGRSGAP